MLITDFLMWAFLPIILNFFMLLGMVCSFKNLLDVGTILSYSVLLAGLVQFIYIYFLEQIFKNSFIFKKPKSQKK